MSLEGVLNRPENVRDLVEVPSRPIRPVWDEIPQDLILNSVIINGFEAGILLLNPGAEQALILEARIAEFKSWIKGRNLSREPSNSENISIEDYLKYASFAVSLEKKPIKHNKKVIQLANSRIEEIIYYCQEGSPSLDSLDFLLHYKINFPSRNVSNAVTAFLTRYTDIIALYSRVANDGAMDMILKTMAYLRLLAPEEFNGIDLPNSSLFKTGLKAVEDNFPQGDRRFGIASVAHLKVLAAESVRIGENGVELVMPEPLKSVSIPPPIPETRRFV